MSGSIWWFITSARTHDNGDKISNVRYIGRKSQNNCETIFEMAAERLFLSVVAILKPFKSKFGKMCFIKKSGIGKISTFFFYFFLSTLQIGGARFNGEIYLFTAG